MKDEHIKALIKEVLQEENSQHTKALQKERAMRVQMYKDSITTAIGCFIISLIPLIIILWAGFTFLTGVFVTVFAALIAVIIYTSIKDDNETREKRVNKTLKQVN
jgi:Flp pilus assembly protein TadB